MARGINKVILIGNLGRDPETRSFANGGTVTNVALATSESWRDRDGNQQERTEWHNVVFHNKLAEITAQYLRKGSKVYIEGALRTRKWQDKNGQDRYTTEVHANEMQMLDGRAGGGMGEGGFDGGYSAPASAPQRSAQPARGGGYGGGAAAAGSSAPMPDVGFEDDDIPF